MLPERSKFLGIPVDAKTLQQQIDRAKTVIRKNYHQTVVSCANPHSLVVAQADDHFRAALKDAEQMVADGVGISFASMLLNSPDMPRITGHDYFWALMRELDEEGGARIAFLGSSEKVLEKIKAQFAIDFPNLILVAMISPPFGDWSAAENDQIIADLNSSKPDVLWVGMTAPKQEKWTYTNRIKLNAKVIGNIGAVFDFYAGTKPRAPKWACRLGVEWAYRLVKEPKRLWRRNLVSTPVFLILVVRQRLLILRQQALQLMR